MTTPDVVIWNATKENGYTEQGGPDGKSGNITKFGQWFGWNGVAWCGIFVSYVFDESGQPLTNVQTPKGFAGCEAAVSWAKKMGLWIPLGKGGFNRGDICIFDEGALQGKPKNGVAGHTGILVTPNKNDCDTIEGNTSPTNRGSQANGGQVAQKNRSLSLFLGVIRPPYTPPTPAAPPPDAPKKVQPPVWPGRVLMLTSPNVTGKDVTMIQYQCVKFGGKLNVTGVYDEATHDQVKWWQHAFHLEDDGIVGRITWDEFFRR